MRKPESPSCSLVTSEGAKISCVEPVARLLTHELRTPLNAIIGFAELLLAGGSGPLTNEARAAVVEIARAAHDLESTMTAAGLLIELGLLPPRTTAGPVAIDRLLAEVGFQLVPAEHAGTAPLLTVEGTADRWAAILGAIRSFLGRRASQRSRCLAAALVTKDAVGVRLWAEPGPVEISDLGRIELSLAARLTAVEGAVLTVACHGEIRLCWPPELATATTVAPGTVRKGVSGVT